MSQCPPRDLNLNAYNSEEEVTFNADDDSSGAGVAPAEDR